MLTSQPENCGAPVGAVSSAGMSAKTPIAKSNGEANAAMNRSRLEMPSARQATTSPQQTKSIASKRLFTGHALMEMPRHKDLGLREKIFQKLGSVAAMMQPACQHVQRAGRRKSCIPCALNQMTTGRMLDRAQLAGDEAGEFVALRGVVYRIGKLPPDLEDFFAVAEDLAFPWRAVEEQAVAVTDDDAAVCQFDPALARP